VAARGKGDCLLLPKESLGGFKHERNTREKGSGQPRKSWKEDFLAPTKLLLPGQEIDFGKRGGRKGGFTGIKTSEKKKKKTPVGAARLSWPMKALGKKNPERKSPPAK